MKQETAPRVTHSDDELVLIDCWNCKKEMSLVTWRENDGFCCHCKEEIVLEDEHN